MRHFFFAKYAFSDADMLTIASNPSNYWPLALSFATVQMQVLYIGANTSDFSGSFLFLFGAISILLLFITFASRQWQHVQPRWYQPLFLLWYLPLFFVLFCPLFSFSLLIFSLLRRYPTVPG
jgi:hypothetical protein